MRIRGYLRELRGYADSASTTTGFPADLLFLIILYADLRGRIWRRFNYGD